MNNLSNVITQLEFAWQAIQAENPELPDAVITSSRRRHKSEKDTRAQHCADTWKKDGELVAEITVFGERLFDGAEEVMQSLLHEAAHALARVRDIKDTSNRNRFHNKKFVKIAEELGLEGPDESGGPALGFSNCVITPVTAKIYADTIKAIDAVLKLYVPVQMDEEEEKPKTPTRKAHCECPSDKEDEPFNSITWAKWMQKKLDEYGVPPLLCGVCRQAFVPEEPEEEEA